MSLEDYLKSRNLSELIIQFSEENIDTTTIVLMTDDQLAKYVPKQGDRVGIMHFCKQKNSATKQSLIQKLSQRLIGKKSDSGKITKGKGRLTKPKRMIEIGWLLFCKDENRYRQVRAKNGGGTRRISMDKQSRYQEILEKGRQLFFPNNLSSKGPIENFELDLLDYKSHPLDRTITIQEMYEISGLTSLRFYLFTIPKHGVSIEIHPDSLIPATITSDRESDGDYVPPDSLRRAERGMLSVETRSRQQSPNQHSASTYFSSFQPVEAPASFDDFFDDFLVVSPEPKQQTMILRRGYIFEDLIKVFEENICFDNGLFKIEMILPSGERELAEDLGGVWRDALSEFWSTFYDKCTVGTSLKVPYIRHDFGEKQWKAIAKVLYLGFEMEKYFPIQIAPVFTKCFLNMDFEDDELVSNFLDFVCETEKVVLEEAQKNFDNVTTDEIIDVFSTYDSKWVPNKDNLAQLLRDIAHQEIVQKPNFVINCFQSELSRQKLEQMRKVINLYKELKPTVSNCLSKIDIMDPNKISNEQKTIFTFLKRFLKEVDQNMREEFFRFCTGSNLPIMAIKVDFTDTYGIKRMPISHTCSGLLQLSSTYENYVEFRNELKSVLTSKVWIMDIV